MEKNELGAYKAAIRHGWHQEAVSHMTPKRRDWDLESLKSSAMNFTTRGAWKEANPPAYTAARRKGLLDVVCAHMVATYKPEGYWTKAHVLESALRYPSIALWNEAETTACQRARKNGWMEEATVHMDAVPMPLGPAMIHQFLMSHDIHYLAEHRFKKFPEVAKKPFDFYLPGFNLIIEYHGKQHLHGWAKDSDSKSAIQHNDRIKREWAKRQGISFLEIRVWKENTQELVLARIVARLQSLSRTCGEILTLTQRSLTAAEARKIKTGLVWDGESILADAAKYRSRVEWMNHSPHAYRFALRHGLSEIATKGMPYVTEHGKWTKAAILASARKYPSLAAWRKAEGSAYVIAIRLGCLEKAKEHMEGGKKPNGYWTKKKVLENARRYTTKAEWRANEPSARAVAVKNGWLDDACAHMAKQSKLGTRD